MVVRMWSNKNSHSLLVGMQNGTDNLEDSLTVSYKTNMLLPYDPSSCTPWYLVKWAENLHPHKNLHTNVYSSFIHNCQNLEITKMSFNKGINKLLYIHTVECYSAIKRNELSSQKKTWKNLKCILLSERSQPKKAIYCVIPTIWHSWNRQKYGDRSVIARDLERGREEWVSGAHGIFRAMKL